MPDESAPRQPHRPTGARVVRLSDFGEACALFNTWQGRFEQLSSGRFEGTLEVVRGELVRVTRTKGNQRLLVRGHDTAGMFGVYPVTGGNAASLWQGRRLTLGQFVVNGDQAEVNHCSTRFTEHVGMTLRPEALEDATRSLLSLDAVALQHTWAAPSPPPGAFVELNRQLARLLSMGVADPSFLGTPEGHRLEQECVRSLVASLFPGPAPTPPVSLPARSLLLRRAEEFMRARLAGPVGAIDLCRELGTSDRTLRLAFRERYGLGPMAYFRCLRLNAVRSRLKSDPLVAIADAAREFGFHHLGNFAADYRRLFGERPSATPRPPSDYTTAPADDHPN